MEIEDLKHIWQKENKDFKPKAETELARMLKGRSSSIIARLKRNVLFELAFTALGGMGLLAYALTLPGGSLKWTSISILILFAVYSLYYLKKLRLLNRFDPGKHHIKSNLQRLILRLTSYLNFYRRSYSFLYPVYFIIALLFVAIERGATDFMDKVVKPEIYIPLLLGAGLFFICSRWVTAWYLKKLYGNDLENLKTLLGELED